MGEVEGVGALRVAPLRDAVRAGSQDAARRAAPQDVAASVDDRAVDGDAWVSSLNDSGHAAHPFVTAL